MLVPYTYRVPQSYPQIRPFSGKKFRPRTLYLLLFWIPVPYTYHFFQRVYPIPT